ALTPRREPEPVTIKSYNQSSELLFIERAANSVILEFLMLAESAVNAHPLIPAPLALPLRLAAVFGIAALTGQHARAITIVPTGNATTLVNTLLGPGVTLVGTPTFTGGNLGNSDSSAATFTGGLSTGIGIDSGVLLTSGFANNVGNSN